MCKTGKIKLNKINFINLIGLLGENFFSKVLQGVKLKKIE